MKLLAAFDKFKDSMTATRACEAAAAGARAVLGSSGEIRSTPLTDGGEGFCRILTEAADGHIEYHPVSGPLGEELDAPLGWVESASLQAQARQMLGTARGRIAIIEMAAVAGLEQVPISQRHPRQTTTRGVGELIRVAVAEQADAILLGIGGSATSDLGLGALEALGLRFHGVRNIVPANWPDVASISGRPDLEFPPIYIACDVENPLLGDRGAASVYGPQKGLPISEIESFDAEAERLAHLLCRHFKQTDQIIKTPGAGAAGGVGFGLKVACGADFVPGFELVEAWLDLPSKIAWADLILTGEGKFDRSSLSGKGPYALLLAAHDSGKPAILLSGALDEDVRAELAERFPQTMAYAISPGKMALEDALARGPENLELKVRSALLERSER